MGEFELSDHHMEKHVGKSMTVPDEAMSVREILLKHTQGLLSGELLREPQYGTADVDDFDDYDVEKLQHADIFEREQEIENLARIIKDKEAAVKAAREKHSARKKAEVEKQKYILELAEKLAKGRGNDPDGERTNGNQNGA